MMPPVGLAALTAAVLGFALGSLPTGYLSARRLRGVDIRRYSPHNLGLPAVAEAAGVPALALATLLDLLKGALAVVAAGGLSSDDRVVAAAGAAVVAGHAYSPYWLLVPPAYARLKAGVVALGVAGALAGTGAIPWEALAAALALGGLVLAGPRLVGSRWGYLSLATVLAALALPVALWVAGGSVAMLALAVGYAALTLWNHKEHLLRIADGAEPHLGERMPLPRPDAREVVAAFLIHPMTVDDVWRVPRFRWLAPLRRWRLVPDAAVRWLARFVKPMKTSDIRAIGVPDGRLARVYLIGVPLLPDQIRAEPALAVRRAVEAAQLAANLGATVMGLGAYWSVVGNKGEEVQALAPIAITNGGAYTAGTVRMAVPLVLERLRRRGVDPAQVTAAVVGANGVVGFGICRQIADQVGRLVMIGTDQARLDRSREVLARRFPNARIEASTDLAVLRDAHVVFTATSTPDPVIRPEHVRQGALLFDLGRPPDVDPRVARVPGVEVVPGGVVRLPGDPQVPPYFDYERYGQHLVPACLAETVVIALDRCYDRVSLGDRTRSEHIDYFVRRAAELGFEVQTGAPDSPAERTGLDPAGSTVVVPPPGR